MVNWRRKVVRQPMPVAALYGVSRSPLCVTLLGFPIFGATITHDLHTCDPCADIFVHELNTKCVLEGNPVRERVRAAQNGLADVISGLLDFFVCVNRGFDDSRFLLCLFVWEKACLRIPSLQLDHHKQARPRLGLRVLRPRAASSPSALPDLVDRLCRGIRSPRRAEGRVSPIGTRDARRVVEAPDLPQEGSVPRSRVDGRARTPRRPGT